MHGERTNDPGRALRLIAAVLLGSASLVAAGEARAGPGDVDGAKGLVFARRRNCVKAVPA